ncbi:AraC family transcriptional regulator [Zymobacter palmae]|uniref:AraC-type DNA-binding domain-containing proteins n=1 Tax=Zymobacter palmae TaxID=33074 RepID=A0A348HGA9_9GAMM|nr:AraC family transcriptional regulator [Zymobacter palmae]BBG30661.1 AraC-type DNA-binding domain-containing proteins [Zymobacter palmae]
MQMALTRMQQLIRALSPAPGYTPTDLPGVTLLYSEHDVARTPLMYSPSITVIVQGTKIGHLGTHRVFYGEGHYLVQTLPVPFECETFASPDAPMMGVSIALRPELMSDILVRLSDITPAHPTVRPTAPMSAVHLDNHMADNVIRLLECLHDPILQAVVGQSRVIEVILDVLRGEQGHAIQALLHHQGPFSRLTKALQYLHAHYEEPLNIQTLACHVNMSASTLHHQFKRLICTSPLQYLKQIRLLKARMLLSQDRLPVSHVAEAVGYKSPSQFSREYKRYFGVPPNDDRQSAGSAVRPGL